MASNIENELKQSGITDSFQKELLESGRADMLSNDRRQRIVANIGLAIGAPPVALSDGGASGHVATSGALKMGGFQSVFAKAFGTAVLGGLSVWGGYSLLQPNTDAVPTQHVPLDYTTPSVKSPEPTDLKAESETQLAQAQLAQARVNAAGVEDVSASNDAPESVTKARKHAASDSLARELAMIESGRAALLRKNPAGTLSTLSKYGKEFPKGTLRAEATVLRVEALIASGNRRAATSVGEAFLRRSPNSPYSRRISSLLGGAQDNGAKAADPKR